ncbi:uncharacterized protein LOC141915189 [Tubulanus polymorphus]|uniref:uncharacterized protein LOC141915189 n=1 Tax=Tubulanus polymorphus TaxID=672921 RepID=UPI003DA3D9A2
MVKGKTRLAVTGFDVERALKNWNISASDSGWTKQGIVLLRFEENFLKAIGSERPQLLIVNGHNSHNFVELIEKARENRIVIVELPSHTSNWLKPLDRPTGLYPYNPLAIPTDAYVHSATVDELKSLIMEMNSCNSIVGETEINQIVGQINDNQTDMTDQSGYFPFDNTSSRSSKLSDILKYPQAEPRKPCQPKPCRLTANYIVITSDEAYVEKCLREEKKSQEPRNKKFKTITKHNNAVTSTDVPAENSSPIPSLEDTHQKLRADSYVAIAQKGERGKNHLYFGIVEKMLPESSSLQIKFLEQLQRRNLFVWTEDIEGHPVSGVIMVLSPPRIINQRCQLSLNVESMKTPMTFSVQ